MKRITWTLAAIAAIAACTPRQPVDDSGLPAVTTSPPESAKPLRFETRPLRVAAASIAEQAPELLANAAWTRKQCALTVPGDNAELAVDRDASVRLAGYFIDPDDRPAGDFDIVLKGEARNYRIPARTGWDRTDVAEFFELPDLAASGFEVDAELSGVPPGRYEVDYMVERAGSRHFCESGKTLVLR